MDSTHSTNGSGMRQWKMGLSKHPQLCYVQQSASSTMASKSSTTPDVKRLPAERTRTVSEAWSGLRSAIPPRGEHRDSLKEHLSKIGKRDTTKIKLQVKDANIGKTNPGWRFSATVYLTYDHKLIGSYTVAEDWEDGERGWMLQLMGVAV